MDKLAFEGSEYSIKVCLGISYQGCEIFLWTAYGNGLLLLGLCVFSLMVLVSPWRFSPAHPNLFVRMWLICFARSGSCGVPLAGLFVLLLTATAVFALRGDGEQATESSPRFSYYLGRLFDAAIAALATLVAVTIASPVLRVIVLWVATPIAALIGERAAAIICALPYALAFMFVACSVFRVTMRYVGRLRAKLSTW